jgi:hypothetical protein
MLVLRFAQHLLEGIELGGRIEKRPTRVGSVQDVINHAPRRRS